jgi:hypothetical protein
MDFWPPPRSESAAQSLLVIGRFAGWRHPGDAPGFVLSLLAAMMILALYRVLKSKAA